MKCAYETTDGYCELHSDGVECREPCAEGPCDDFREISGNCITCANAYPSVNCINCGPSLRAYREALAAEVDEAPTVDAVPVVRCKDCMYRDTENCLTAYYRYAGDRFPDIMQMDDDDYCSRGKVEQNDFR